MISAMLRALEHRGPDDEGLWHNANGTTRLAHARLSILDLSPAGHQPMHSADGRFTIVFNGEIYNHAEVRVELEKKGVLFRTHSDTEVILAAYERWHRLKQLPDGRWMLASPLVARMLESIKSVAALETPARYQPRSAQDDALRFLLGKKAH